MNEYYVWMTSEHSSTFVTKGTLTFCLNTVELLKSGNTLDSFWIEDGAGRLVNGNIR